MNYVMRDSLLDRIDSARLNANQEICAKSRSALGQFMTSKQIAAFMCSLFASIPAHIRLLDPGAGVGSLTAAFVDYMCARDGAPKSIEATAYEVDKMLAAYLDDTMGECAISADERGIAFCSQLENADFIHDGVEKSCSLSKNRGRFTHVIMNPPYKKINTASEHRLSLRRVGVETSNLYTGFLALAALLLEDGGELVAITPRSFCNGPYFLPFRKMFFQHMILKHVHVFETRNKAFSDDDVLQENVIFRAVKGGKRDRVRLSVSSCSRFSDYSYRDVDYAQVISPHDSDLFVHLLSNEHDDLTATRMKTFQHSLEDIGVSVSTGPVVDFRLKECLRQDPVPNAVPLIYPGHCQNSFVTWPVEGRKPNAIIENEKSSRWLMPNGYYAVVKRFSAKEEKRRVAASVHDPGRVEASLIGFENHLNVFHANKRGLPEPLAKGLALYLNSSLVDAYFRQFNGHTQVNATDLRKLKYPSREQLISLGMNVNGRFPEQGKIDLLIEELESEISLGEQDEPEDRTSIESSGTVGASSRAA